MVGTKGARGPPGPPGKCSCSSLSASPYDDYPHTGTYAKVPVVSKIVATEAQYLKKNWSNVLRNYSL